MNTYLDERGRHVKKYTTCPNCGIRNVKNEKLIPKIWKRK